MVQVSDRYLLSRLGRISSVAASKSAAWRLTTSITACAKPAWVFPMILMGKSQGNASRGVSFSGMSRGAHHLRLELLVESVDARRNRAGFAAAHALAVERGDRQHFARGRGHPDLVRRAQLALRDGPQLVSDRVRA